MKHAMAEPITCELYNRIADVDKQQDALECSTLSSLWSDITEIFVRHVSQDDFGLALLHRHMDLPRGHAMVHSYDHLERDLCRPEILGTRKVYPLSYCIQDDCFMAYEFAVEPTPTPAAPFLRDMKGLLQRHQLGSIIAVAHISDQKCTWVETMLEDCTGTVAIKSGQDLGSWPDIYITTEWAFRDETGTPRMVAVKGCERLRKTRQWWTCSDLTFVFTWISDLLTYNL